MAARRSGAEHTGMNDLDKMFLEVLGEMLKRDIHADLLRHLGNCNVHMKSVSQNEGLGLGLAVEFTLDFVVFPQLGTWHDKKPEREPLGQAYDFEGTVEEEPTALPEVRKQLGEGR